MEHLGLIIVIAISVTSVLSIVLIIAHNWLKAEPNEALIFPSWKGSIRYLSRQ